MSNFGMGEILVVAVIALVLFGSSKLPKFARSLGQAKNEFESGLKHGDVDNNQLDLRKSKELPEDIKK